MGKKMSSMFIFLLVAIFPFIIAEPVKDKQALLDFLQHIHHSRSLNWSKETSVCNNWIGVTCNSDRSRVIALRLPGVGLRGPIPTNTLSRLSAVEVISLRSNGISGSFPSDFAQLQNLTTLYLHSNKFSGTLPDFSVWNNLTIIDLSNNGFNGSIPPSVSKLTHLTILNLSNNSLSGDIPEINIASLQQLDLANNNLTGIVPKSLERFPSWAFSGNNLSSEKSLPPPALPSQPPNAHEPSKKAKKLGEPSLLGIIIGGSLLLFVLVALLMICCYSMKQKEQEFPPESRKKEVYLKKKVSENHDKDNRLVFFEGCNLAFDLEDLLRASAEVLGKGTFGVTYKAALEDATTVAVKRLKEVTSGKREFEQQMEAVGCIKHENVSRLRAYYYSKDEKLVVHDYYNQGSVSALLHGKRGEGRRPLDWETRLQIAIDVGFAAVMSPMPPPAMRAAGYRAPEVTDTRKATQASDVYSYGVLLLELLTGKSPIHATGGEEIVHLVRWVHSVVREEWTAEVFDVELLQYPNIEEEMVEMLQIGMSCVVRIPEQRPKMSVLVKMMEGIRRANMGNQPSFETKPETSTSTQIRHSAEIVPSSPVPSSPVPT
ncbi:hypothetical protein V6N11_059057 [Hibiscus sabdariffa]|uniref:Protein kinase domain-containing protein n=1 Tax=Hibiscus sabdariffa TaxID=183260 RepID=A0ABR2U622_9ROSI